MVTFYERQRAAADRGHNNSSRRLALPKTCSEHSAFTFLTAFLLRFFCLAAAMLLRAKGCAGGSLLQPFECSPYW